MAGRSKEQWYLDNQENVKQTVKDYRQANPDKVRKININCHENNKEHLNTTSKNYYEQHKSSIIDYAKNLLPAKYKALITNEERQLP